MSQHTIKMYSISAFLDGEYVMQTDSFETLQQCQHIMKVLTQAEQNKFSFQMYESTPTGGYVNTVEGPEVPAQEREMLDLSDMTLESYKNGLLLRPPSNIVERDEGAISKYYLGGWWMPIHDAWFFKTKYLDMLNRFNVELIGPLSTEHESHQTTSLVGDDYNSQTDSDYSPSDCDMDTSDTEEEEDTSDTEEVEVTSDTVNNDSVTIADSNKHFDLVNCYINTYGRGYIVRPYKSHKDYSKKYYGPGWWMPSQKGWFFRQEYYQELVHAGGRVYGEMDATYTARALAHSGMDAVVGSVTHTDHIACNDWSEVLKVIE